jgi:ferredoxin
MKVCPVNCFYDAGKMLVIHPDECIDCGLCVPECPVQAIYSMDNLPQDQRECVDINKDFFNGKSPEELSKLRQLP